MMSRKGVYDQPVHEHDEPLSFDESEGFNLTSTPEDNKPGFCFRTDESESLVG